MPVWSIDEQILKEAEEAFGDILTNWGRKCRLYYPAKKVSCVNCVYDPIGKKSANRFLTGGPAPFPAGGTCPVCSGSGFREQEMTEDVLLICAFSPKEFFYPIDKLNIRSPDGMIQVKGKLEDIPKIKRATRIRVDVDKDPHLRLYYQLCGEPIDIHNIVRGKFFVCLLERTGAVL